MSNHTLGNWSCEESGLQFVVYAKDSEGCDRRICEMVGPGSAGNGKLAAAAPNLLDALMQLVGTIEAHELESLNCNRTDETWCNCLESKVEFAKTAIAKATS